MNNRTTRKLVLSIAMTIFVSGCATTAPKKFVPLMPATINATPADVQSFILSMVSSSPKYSKFQIHSQNNTTLELRTLCTNVENPFKCAAIMMMVGNSGWSGPYMVEVFHTLLVHGKTELHYQEEMCATNMAGHTNCKSTASNELRNKAVAGIARAYKAKYGDL